MDRFGSARIALLVLILIVAQAPLAAQAHTGQVASSSYVPVGGDWTGTTTFTLNGKTYHSRVTFTVDALGTSWSNFRLYTRFVFPNGCTATGLNAQVTSGSITNNYISGSGGPTFSFTGNFTSATTASGTFNFTKFPVASPCYKTFSQSGTWAANAPFSKLGPANATADQAVSPSLTWAASPGTTGYEYCVDTAVHADNDTTCPGGWQSNGTARTVLVNPLLSPTSTYYWQVRAQNATLGDLYANSGIWWSFTTGVLPVGPSKSSPSDGATGQVLNNTLSWGTSVDATGYDYCFDTTDNDICDTTWTSTGANTTVDPPGVFLPGTTYYWQARAVNATGPTEADGGTWWSFTTIPPLEFDIPSNGWQDGYILESSERSNLGGKMNASSTTFFLGDNKAKRQYRSILSFATNTIPSKAVITGVQLKILKAGGSTVSPFSVLGNILVDVKKGTFGTAALQLSDFKTAGTKNNVAQILDAPIGGWYSVSLPSTGITYINRTGLTQLRLRFAKDDNNDSVGNYMTFYSGDDLTASNRPELVILYYLAP